MAETGALWVRTFAYGIVFCALSLAAFAEDADTNAAQSRTGIETTEEYAEAFEACLREKFPQEIWHSAIAQSTCDPEMLIPRRDGFLGGGGGGAGGADGPGGGGWD